MSLDEKFRGEPLGMEGHVSNTLPVVGLGKQTLYYALFFSVGGAVVAAGSDLLLGTDLYSNLGVKGAVGATLTVAGIGAGIRLGIELMHATGNYISSRIRDAIIGE